jgi:hypothetical protein
MYDHNPLPYAVKGQDLLDRLGIKVGPLVDSIDGAIDQAIENLGKVLA